ncbi:MFS transporter [Microbacterium sp. LWO13-1.2]|uniref:MFS transporter n=1 Tax=Microbacterium sp. LWO13-1.2 TaxID=3135262 RepID=UPI003138E3A5
MTGNDSAPPSDGSPIGPIHSGRWKSFALIALGVTSLALRPSLTAIGALTPAMLAGGELSVAQLGFLGSVPLIVFAMFSSMVPALLHRVRITTALTVAMSAVVVGSLLRVAPGAALLYGGTALIAAGLCVGNVLLPVAARAFFPHRVGRVTGICTALISAGGGAGVALALPLADGLRAGWRVALAITAATAAVAAVAWLMPVLRVYEAGRPRIHLPSSSTKTKADASTVVMAGAFFGAQASFFYLAASWLLPLLMEKSNRIEQATFGVGAFSFAGVLTCLVAPSLALGKVGLRGMILVVSTLQIVGATGVFCGTGFVALGGAVVLAVGVTAAFSLSIVIFSIAAGSAHATVALSGRAQSLGYTIAAVFPFVAGLVRMQTGSWLVVEASMLVLAAVTLISGLLLTTRQRGLGRRDL